MSNEVIEPVLDDDVGVFPSVSSASASSRLLSSSFISLSYSTHSGTIRAAADSLGSLVLGLLHCSQEVGRGGVEVGCRLEGKAADKTHQSQQHQCHFLPATPILYSQQRPQSEAI